MQDVDIRTMGRTKDGKCAVVLAKKVAVDGVPVYWKILRSGRLVVGTDRNEGYVGVKGVAGEDIATLRKYMGAKQFVAHYNAIRGELENLPELIAAADTLTPTTGGSKTAAALPDLD